MLKGWGMLLNLSPVKIPPFLYFIKGASFLWIIRVSLMFGSVETSPTALSNQRISKVSEGMMSSRCFYSALIPSQVCASVISTLFPLAPSLSANSLLSARFRCLLLFISVLDLILSYRIAVVVVLRCLLHWSNYHAVRNADQIYLYIDFIQKCKLQIQYIFTSAMNVSISI